MESASGSSASPELPLESAHPLILVVEDSSTQRRIISNMLVEQIGARIIDAEDGKAALAALKRELPVLVVTDMIMPIMDGLELVEEVRVVYPNLPVILMTGSGSEELALRALQAGAASYVPKSCMKDALAPTIESIIASARKERRRNRVLESVKCIETVFELENDPALVPSFITQMQEQMSRMKICTENRRIRVGVALEEALLNGLYHGNLELSSDLRQDGSNRFNELAEQRRFIPPYRDRRLHVQVRISTREASFVIRDEGPGFDISKLPDPTDPENMMKASGRGLLLIRTFMDEAFHNPTGNQLTMVMRAQT